MIKFSIGFKNQFYNDLQKRSRLSYARIQETNLDSEIYPHEFDYAIIHHCYEVFSKVHNYKCFHTCPRTHQIDKRHIIY